jgi:hypothetical protein
MRILVTDEYLICDEEAYEQERKHWGVEHKDDEEGVKWYQVWDAVPWAVCTISGFGNDRPLPELMASRYHPFDSTNPDQCTVLRDYAPIEDPTLIEADIDIIGELPVEVPKDEDW